MLRQTPLYERHVAAGARMVDFGGWAMPLHYGSQMDEHHAVRATAGVFDVSHMTVVDVAGPAARDWLRRLLANNVDKLGEPGRGLYSCMLNDAGGVIDDLIVYWLGGQRFRLVVNAATREADLAWLAQHSSGLQLDLTERADLAMLAVQGPRACALLAPALPGELAAAATDLSGFSSTSADDIFVARTGYTGEDGWEIVAPPAVALELWDAALAAGIAPAGLGARDTLRLEAGLNLYGQDMTLATSPLESNLGWTVAMEPVERDFTGRQALTEQRVAGVDLQLTGLVLEARGVMRAGQQVETAAGPGTITSGGFSPTLQRSIALARVPADAAAECSVMIRGKAVPARMVRPPFVRQGKSLLQ